MNKTLHIDANLLDKAFAIASRLNIDLSVQVERFIQRFVNQSQNADAEITPFVASLGVEIPSENSKDIDEGYRNYLENKYK